MWVHREYKNSKVIFVSLGMETEASNDYLKKQISNTSAFMVVKEKLTYIKIFMLFSLL